MLRNQTKNLLLHIPFLLTVLMIFFLIWLLVKQYNSALMTSPSPPLNTSPGKNCTGFPFQNVLSIKSLQCMCFSAINGSGPAYLSELLHVYTPSRTLCSSSDTCMLEIQQYKRKTHGFCTFSCFGPHIWNSLPQDLRHCSTLSSFKAKLKTFLFSQYFHRN